MKGVETMAKILTKQIHQINNACSNDWRLDTQYFLFHTEKTLHKKIKLDEKHFLRFRLSYNSNNQIILHISKFYHKQGEDLATSSGLGKTKILNENPAKRRMTSNLIELTKDLDNKTLMEINNTTPVSKGYGIILESEDF